MRCALSYCHLKRNTAATRVVVVVSMSCVCHTACLTLLNHSVRVCLCVTAVCVSVSVFGHGDRATPSRVVLHAAYPSPRETSAAHPVPESPSVGGVTAGFPETLLSTRGLLLYRQTLLSGTDLPSHLVSEVPSRRCYGKSETQLL